MKLFFALFFLSKIPAQCLKSAGPFQLLGANDQFVSCILPSSNAPLQLSLVSEVPDAAVCVLACDQGYDTNTPLSRTITCNGTAWTGSVDSVTLCRPLSCPTLTAPLNSASASCIGAREGSMCNMTCSAGFKANQFSSRVCRDGSWTGGALVCTPKACPDIIAPADSIGSSCIGKQQGEQCAFACVGGAVAAGTPNRICSNGAWSGTSFTCTLANTCPQLYSPPGAFTTVCARFAAGQECTFKAMPGFTISNASRICQAGTLTWSGNESRTIALTCPALATPANAEPSTSCMESVQGTVCTQRCSAGFVSSQGGVWTCHNQQWVGVPLVCSPMNCPVLTAPDNAVMGACDGKVEGDLCTFFCQPGFKSIGHGARVCRNGQWTGYSFQCTPAATRYVWVASSFGTCLHNITQQPCGEPLAGVLTRQVACIDTSLATFAITNNDNCQNQPSAHEVSATLECALEPCPSYAWQYGAWESVCSAECGTGYQERTAVCRGSNGAVVDGSMCPSDPSPRLRECNTQACTGAHYVASVWSPCSGACYNGQGVYNTRSRNVQCLDVLGNLAPISQCSVVNAPPSTQDCNTQPCSAYTWSECPWEACTAQCNGGGTEAGLMAGQKSRNVFCQDPLGNGVSASLCANFGLPSPVTLLVGCNPLPCASFNWMTTPWSACSGTGASGTRTRSYHCHKADGSNALNSECPAPPPTTQEACIPNSCPTMAPTNLGTFRPTSAPRSPQLGAGAQTGASVVVLLMSAAIFVV